MNFQGSWPDFDIVAFDTETSGVYPWIDDVVEIGLVRWRKGQIIEEFQTFCRPKKPMSDFVIGIHGISNAMVADAEPATTFVPKLHELMSNALVFAHHAPFDLGFITPLFENTNHVFPDSKLFCSSLLARKLIRGSPNHKLQTLVKHLSIPVMQAHRALDDARACLHVALHCLRILGDNESLETIQQAQQKELVWDKYRLFSDELITPILRAAEQGKDISIMYGADPMFRSVRPLGVIRNPDGDYIKAFCNRDQKEKRFQIDKIKR